MEEYCEVTISATSKEEAENISDVLLKKKLAAGTLITKGDSRYWWEGEVVEKEYYNVRAFSLMKNKQKIIDEVEKIHEDETPIIAFHEIDENEKFLNWIKHSTK